jgi:uncharacterized Zn finger protein
MRIPADWWHDFPPEYGFRGQKYEQAGRVVSAHWLVTEQRLDALVRGRDGKVYDVRIRLPRAEEGRQGVEGRCTCPVAFNCKHVAAVLIAVQRGLEVDGDPDR